jgi:hypothetical protein
MPLEHVVPNAAFEKPHYHTLALDAEAVSLK